MQKPTVESDVKRPEDGRGSVSETVNTALGGAGTTERQAGDLAVAAFNRIRTDVKHVAAALKEVRGGFVQSPATPIEDRGEVMANLTLA